MRIAGIGFLRSTDRDTKWTITLTDRDKNPIRKVDEAWRCLRMQGDHLLVIDAGHERMKIGPNDKILVLSYGDDPKSKFSLDIDYHAKPTPPPPPVHAINRVKFIIDTGKDEDKDPNGRIMLKLLGADGRVLTENGWHGERTKWENNDHKEFEWSTPPIPAPSGARFTARILLENFYKNDVFGLFWDAVKWNATCRVELLLDNGQQLVGTASRNLKAEANHGTDELDISIPQ